MKILKFINSVRLLTGIKNIWSKKWKSAFPILFLVAVFFAWYMTRDSILKITSSALSTFLLWGFSLVVIAIAVIGVLLIVSILGTPLSAKRVEMCLYNVGFKDRAGNTPLLLSRFREAKAEVLEFYSPTIPIT